LRGPVDGSEIHEKKTLEVGSLYFRVSYIPGGWQDLIPINPYVLGWGRKDHSLKTSVNSIRAEFSTTFRWIHREKWWENPLGMGDNLHVSISISWMCGTISQHSPNS